MEWNYTVEEPERVSERRVLAMAQRTVVYAVEVLTAEEAEGSGCGYRSKSVTLEPGVWSYDAIVDALVTAEYPSGKMQAIVNNYLATADDAGIRGEFEAMQSWRKEAKRIAKEALGEG